MFDVISLGNTVFLSGGIASFSLVFVPTWMPSGFFPSPIASSDELLRQKYITRNLILVIQAVCRLNHPKPQKKILPPMIFLIAIAPIPR